MTVAIVGAGLSGLVAAGRVVEMYPGRHIIVIDQAARPGGLLGGTYYDAQDLYFDIGTHIYKEIGRPEIDRLLRDVVPAADLISMTQQTGDLSGAIYGGRLQANSHFPDLRGQAALRDAADALTARALEGDTDLDLNRMRPLVDFAEARFGAQYAQDVIVPILADMFGRPVEDLATFALFLPGLTRAIVDNPEAWHTHEHNAVYRALVAYPEQRTLPTAYRHGLGHFYTRTHGSNGVVLGLVAYLEERGVQIWTDTKITDVDLDRGALSVQRPGPSGAIVQADQIIFATGAIGTAALLGCDLRTAGLDRPLSHWILNLVLEAPSGCDLQYLYGFDTDCPWYRVTNYNAFSGQDEDCRMTVEVLGDRIGDPIHSAQAIAQQLYDHGVAGSPTITFSASMKLKSGFPVPSIRNMAGIEAVAKTVRAQLGARHILCGVGSQGGVFFQNEVLVGAYDSVSEKLRC